MDAFILQLQNNSNFSLSFQSSDLGAVRSARWLLHHGGINTLWVLRLLGQRRPRIKTPHQWRNNVVESLHAVSDRRIMRIRNKEMFPLVSKGDQVYCHQKKKLKQETSL